MPASFPRSHTFFQPVHPSPHPCIIYFDAQSSQRVSYLLEYGDVDPRLPLGNLPVRAAEVGGQASKEGYIDMNVVVIHPSDRHFRIAGEFLRRVDNPFGGEAEIG